MNSTPIINFCKGMKVRYFDVNIEITKKNIIVENKNYTKFIKKCIPYNGELKYGNVEYLLGDEEKYKSMKKYKNYDYIWVDTSYYHHIDVDFVEWETYSAESQEFVNSLIERKFPYFKSKTKPLGYHFMFNLVNLPGELKSRCQTKFKDIEVLISCGAWIHKDTKIINYRNRGMIIELEEFKSYFENNELPLKPALNVDDEGVHSDDDKESMGYREKVEIVKNIDIKYCNNYDSCCKIIWALRNDSRDNKKLAQAFCSRGDTYDYEWFYKIWKNTKPGNSISTVCYYSKKSNLNEFKKIKAKYMVVDSNLATDDYLAELFLDDSGMNYVYKYKNLYTYHNKIWSIDYGNNKLCYFISKVLFDILEVKNINIGREISIAINQQDYYKTEKLEEKRKFLLKVQTSILSVSKIEKISKRIIHLLNTKNFDHIEFDSNPYLFPFNNKTYHLKEHDWVKPKLQDYILSSCRYDYEEPTEDELDELGDLIKQIFPDKEIRKTYVCFMATSLFGIPIEKLIIANGSGGNGKGVINELLTATLGELGYVASNDILLNPIKTGANPAVANMNNKRGIIYREPGENHKLCGSAIKELTGGTEINARALYSNNNKTILRGTHILECNKKPKIDGRKDDSIERRLVDIPFESTFTSKTDILEKNLDNVYKANIKYKSEAFKKKYRSVLFKYLINFIKNYSGDVCDNPYVCNRVKLRTKAYIQDCDDLYIILSESLEKTETKTDVVSCKDLYQIYKCSYYFNNLCRKQKGERNYKWFRTELECNNNYKMYFKEKYQPRVNGEQKCYNNVLLFHKLKIINQFIEDDLN